MMVTNVQTRPLGDRLDDLLDQVTVGDEIVLERAGQPHAALITAAAYEDFQRLRADELRRRAAGERLEALRTRVRARNQDLTQAEAEALADRAARDAVDSLAERGAIEFERERSSTER